MNEKEAMCPRFEAAMKMLGKRWTGLVIRVLLDGPARFSEMAGRIPEMSDRMLAERLRELEAEGIVHRDVFPETPVRIEYRLTEKGRALAPVMDQVHAWADQWLLTPSGR
ncbi:MAG: winged helix-turn-helix transcriptional regulator [Clostridia bacterium]|jgi:DNA-binding HxlR family transcriptional regulator